MIGNFNIQQLEELFVKHRQINKNVTIDFGVAHSLGQYIEKKAESFIDQIIVDTQYCYQDVKDIVDGSIELALNFKSHFNEVSYKIQKGVFSYQASEKRELLVGTKPYGVVAAMTPRNAPLILELTIILNALYSGNSVIIRPSSGCVGSINLLMEAIIKTFPTDALQKVDIFMASPQDFLSVSYRYADVIHYIGSSLHARKILNDSLDHNVKVLVDGEGVSTVVVDDKVDVDWTVNACVHGIIRCNGQLCSSIRTIVVHKNIFSEFSIKLTKALRDVIISDPHSANTQMGSLFSSQQVKNNLRAAKKYTLLSGQIVTLPQGDRYMAPLLLKLKETDFRFLKEPIFGPVVGITSYQDGSWKRWLIENPLPLTDAVISESKAFVDEFIATSRAPRIVVNNDPSIESVFEPWGAFLPGGSNEVSFWANKYRKMIQIDRLK